MAKSFWMADQKGNYSNDKNDTFDENNDYLGVRMQQGVPFLDRDWNELEDIRRYQDMMLRKNYICDGTPDNGFMISKVPDIEDFKISKGRYMVGGIEAVNRKDINYKGQTEVTALKTPGAERTDLVYIELTIKEVQGPKNEKDIDMQTCLRHAVHWIVKVRENSRELPEPEPFKWRASIALLKRNGGSLEIEDLRLKNGFDIDHGNLHVRGELTVDKDSAIGGKLDVRGGLTVDKNSAIKGKLDVAEAANVNGPLDVKKSATISEQLHVLGSTIDIGPESNSKISAETHEVFDGLSLSQKDIQSGNYVHLCRIGRYQYGPNFIGRSEFHGHLVIKKDKDDIFDSDFARAFPCNETTLLQRLVRIDGNGNIVVSTESNDPSIIGVVVSMPSMIFCDSNYPRMSKIPANEALNMLENKAKKGYISKDLLKQSKEGKANQKEILSHLQDSDAANQILVAYAGVVECTADGEIAPGDLLTSGKHGYAKADNNAKPGTIVGRALSKNKDGIVTMLFYRA